MAEIQINSKSYGEKIVLQTLQLEFVFSYLKNKNKLQQTTKVAISKERVKQHVVM